MVRLLVLDGFNGQKYLDHGFGSARFILDISKVHKLLEKIPGVGFYPFPL